MRIKWLNWLKLVQNPPAGEEAFVLDLLENHRIPQVLMKPLMLGCFLRCGCQGTEKSPILSAERATELLGTMQGGYNIEPLIAQLDNPALAPLAVKALSHTLLMFDSFHDVVEKMEAGNEFAKQVVEAWANADWFKPSKTGRQSHSDSI